MKSKLEGMERVIKVFTEENSSELIIGLRGYIG